MVKYQKNDGVFTKIVGTSKKKNLYDVFLQNGEDQLKGNDQIQKFSGIYRIMVERYKEDMECLAKVEELIMQYRHYDEFIKKPNIRFSIGGKDNKYIYAYVNFYRHGYIRPDIKEIVGKTEIYGADHRKFSGNGELITRAVRFLDRTMNETIRNTEEDADKLIENKFGNNK